MSNLTSFNIHECLTLLEKRSDFIINCASEIHCLWLEPSAVGAKWKRVTECGGNMGGSSHKVGKIQVILVVEKHGKWSCLWLWIVHNHQQSIYNAVVIVIEQKKTTGMIQVVNQCLHGTNILIMNDLSILAVRAADGKSLFKMEQESAIRCSAAPSISTEQRYQATWICCFNKDHLLGMNHQETTPIKWIDLSVYFLNAGLFK